MEQKRWRQALAISLVLNVLLVITIGGLCVPFTSAAEEVIEIELVATFPAKPAAIASTAAAAQPAAPGTAQAVPAVQASATAEKMITEQPFLTGAEATVSAESPAGGSGVTSQAPSAAGTPAVANGSPKPKTILPPRILRRVEPVYPQAARQQGLEGIVRVRIQVGADGSASSVSIAASSGHDLLDNAALQAVYQWRFVPAKEAETGIAVPCVTSFPVAFQFNS